MPVVWEIPVSAGTINIPVATQAAMTGTEGTPSAINRFVTEDTRDLLAENKNGAIMIRGQPLAKHSSGAGVVLASAIPGKTCIGFCSRDADVGFGTRVRSTGIITLTSWLDITGTIELLPNVTYFLSPLSGKLVTEIPNTGIAQSVGSAADTQTMLIKLGIPILL
jgi:hypothetical protein